MSLRKRGTVWWIDFVTPNGERVRRSAETPSKGQAQELHDKLKAEAWRLQKLGDRPRRLWNDAVVRWLKETNHKATHEGDKATLRWLDPYLNGRPLDTINRAMIDGITQAKLATGVANATVNRTLALVRAVLRRCERDWEWIDRAPAVVGREALIDAVWQRTFVGSNVVDAVVRTLRQKLGPESGRIQTVPKTGYRFVPG